MPPTSPAPGNHALKLIWSLAALRLDDTFTDCVLSAGDYDVRVHAAVAAAASPYLRVALTGGSISTSFAAPITTIVRGRPEYRLELNVISALGLLRIVDFIYTGEVGVTINDAAEVMAAASYLLVHEARNAVIASLKSQLAPDTWARVREIGEVYSSPDLVVATMEWAAANFGDVTRATHAWRAVPRAWVEELLALEELGGCIHGEDDVLAAALSWVEEDAELLELLLLRLPYVSAESLDKLSRFAAAAARGEVWAARACFSGGAHALV